MIINISLTLEELKKCPEIFGIELAKICEDQPVLDELAKDESHLVRIEVAKNKNTSPTTLDKLARTDTDYRVRCALTKNPNLDFKTIVVLSNDDALVVRTTLAKIRNEKTIQALLADNDLAEVRTIVAEKWSLEEESFEYDEAMLCEFAKDLNPQVANAVAKREDITENIMKVLSKHPSKLVRRTLALNRTATRAILMKLAQDLSSDVRRYVAKNPNSTADILHVILEKDRNNYNTVILIIEHKNTDKGDINALLLSNNRIIANRAANRLHKNKS